MIKSDRERLQEALSILSSEQQSSPHVRLLQLFAKMMEIERPYLNSFGELYDYLEFMEMMALGLVHRYSFITQPENLRKKAFISLLNTLIQYVNCKYLGETEEVGAPPVVTNGADFTLKDSLTINHLMLLVDALKHTTYPLDAGTLQQAQKLSKKYQELNLTSFSELLDEVSRFLEEKTRVFATKNIDDLSPIPEDRAVIVNTFDALAVSDASMTLSYDIPTKSETLASELRESSELMASIDIYRQSYLARTVSRLHTEYEGLNTAVMVHLDSHFGLNKGKLDELLTRLEELFPENGTLKSVRHKEIELITALLDVVAISHEPASIYTLMTLKTVEEKKDQLIAQSQHNNLLEISEKMSEKFYKVVDTQLRQQGKRGTYRIRRDLIKSFRELLDNSGCFFSWNDFSTALFEKWRHCIKAEIGFDIPLFDLAKYKEAINAFEDEFPGSLFDEDGVFDGLVDNFVKSISPPEEEMDRVLGSIESIEEELVQYLKERYRAEIHQYLEAIYGDKAYGSAEQQQKRERFSVWVASQKERFIANHRLFRDDLRLQDAVIKMINTGGVIDTLSSERDIESLQAETSEMSTALAREAGSLRKSVLLQEEKMLLQAQLSKILGHLKDKRLLGFLRNGKVTEHPVISMFIEDSLKLLQNKTQGLMEALQELYSSSPELPILFDAVDNNEQYDLSSIEVTLSHRAISIINHAKQWDIFVEQYLNHDVLDKYVAYLKRCRDEASVVSQNKEDEQSLTVEIKCGDTLGATIDTTKPKLKSFLRGVAKSKWAIAQTLFNSMTLSDKKAVLQEAEKVVDKRTLQTKFLAK